ARQPADHQPVRQPIDLHRSAAARRDDGVDARRRARRAAQGVRQAARLAARRAGPRHRQPAELAADFAGGAVEARAAAADRVHAAGRRPVPQRTGRAVSRQVRDVDMFLAVSEYYVPTMAKMLAIPPERMAVVPLGIDLTGYESRRSG